MKNDPQAPHDAFPTGTLHFKVYHEPLAECIVFTNAGFTGRRCGEQSLLKFIRMCFCYSQYFGEYSRFVLSARMLRIETIVQKLFERYDGSFTVWDAHRISPSGVAYRCAKFRSSFKPSAWLFSGWNCVANTLPRAMAAQNG